MSKPMSEAAYQKAIERLAKQYGPKMARVLNRIAAACQALGLASDTAGPELDNTGDDYQCSILVSYPGADEEDQLDIRLELAESLSYEGSTDGVNFMLTSSLTGGEMVGPQMTPFNYSADVWVKPTDARAVAERWDYFEQADPTEAARLAKQALDQRRLRRHHQRRRT